MCYFFFFKQKTAYEMRISDWSSDVCSSDLRHFPRPGRTARPAPAGAGDGDQHDRPGGGGHCRRPAPGLRQDRGGRYRSAGAGGGAYRRGRPDRKSTRLNSITNAHLVCRLLLEKKKVTEATAESAATYRKQILRTPNPLIQAYAN